MPSACVRLYQFPYPLLKARFVIVALQFAGSVFEFVQLTLFVRGLRMGHGERNS